MAPRRLTLPLLVLSLAASNIVNSYMISRIKEPIADQNGDIRYPFTEKRHLPLSLNNEYQSIIRILKSGHARLKPEATAFNHDGIDNLDEDFVPVDQLDKEGSDVIGRKIRDRFNGNLGLYKRDRVSINGASNIIADKMAAAQRDDILRHG